MIEITAKKLKETIIQHFEINKKLSEKGFLPNSIRIIGHSGIGKTSVAIDAVEELRKKYPELAYEKKNLANLSDSADLVGYPKTQTLVEKNGVQKWVWDNNLNSYQDWNITEESRTSYSPPDWVKKMEHGGIILFDDYNRASQRIMQAIMDILDRREYYSWKLPSNVLILLTGNPSNDEYNVVNEDSAQTTRYITYHTKFDFESWKEWAIKKSIKQDYIDFIGINGKELFEDNKDNKNKTNIRQWTRLFTADSTSDLEAHFLNDLAKACVGEENAIMFTNFMLELNVLDFEAEKVLSNKKYDVIKNTIEKLIYKKDYYRHSVSIIILTRIISYIKSLNLTNDKHSKDMNNYKNILINLLQDNIFNNDAIDLILNETIDSEFGETFLDDDRIMTMLDLSDNIEIEEEKS